MAGQRSVAVPGAPHGIERRRVVAGVGERAHLLREATGRDPQVGVRRAAGRRRRDHVVHEDRAPAHGAGRWGLRGDGRIAGALAVSTIGAGAGAGRRAACSGGWHGRAPAARRQRSDGDGGKHGDAATSPHVRLIVRRDGRRYRWLMLFGQEHVKRYIETDGEEGHDWRDGVPTLILTTTGRRSGEPRPTPLIYGRHGDDYLVVASKGGAPEPPAWYLNLSERPGRPGPGQGRPLPRPRAHRDGRGEARAVADHGRDLARLRRVPGQDRPRDPGGGARARRMTPVAEQLAAWAAGLEPSDDDLALARRSLVDTVAVAVAARAHPIGDLLGELLGGRGVGGARARPGLRRPAHGVDVARQRGVRARGARDRRRRARLPGGGRASWPASAPRWAGRTTPRAGTRPARPGLRPRRPARRSRWGSAPRRWPRPWRSRCPRPAASSARSARRPRRCRSGPRRRRACAPRGWRPPARRPIRARSTSGSRWWAAMPSASRSTAPPSPAAWPSSSSPAATRCSARSRRCARSSVDPEQVARVVVRTPQSALAPLIHDDADDRPGGQVQPAVRGRGHAARRPARDRELHRRGRRPARGAGAAGARRGRRDARRRLAAGRRRRDRAHARRRLDAARAARPPARRARPPAVVRGAGREGDRLRRRPGRRGPGGRLGRRRRAPARAAAGVERRSYPALTGKTDVRRSSPTRSASRG